MRIEADHEKLQYSGRIDFSDKKAPVFVFPCTSVGIRFTKGVCSVYVKNRNLYWDNYLGCILDGEQSVLKLPQNGDAVIDIHIPKTGGDVHELLLFKRQDSCHEVAFFGFELADGAEVLDMEDKPVRKIEVYGDSVSAGEVSEAVSYTGKEDPKHNGEYSNSWYSYAWMTARRLHAQIHDIAQGGIALMNRNGWFCEPDAVGMESIWDKIHYHPQFGEASPWDFSKYTPHVVIVALGQNDSHPWDYMKEDYHGKEAALWRAHYRQFLMSLRDRYPKAQIICCTTLLEHDKNWDASISKVCEELGDSNITYYMFCRNGCGTPGHLRISEAEEMAEELSAYIESLPIEDWK